MKEAMSSTNLPLIYSCAFALPTLKSLLPTSSPFPLFMPVTKCSHQNSGSNLPPTSLGRGLCDCSSLYLGQGAVYARKFSYDPSESINPRSATDMGDWVIFCIWQRNLTASCVVGSHLYSLEKRTWFKEKDPRQRERFNWFMSSEDDIREEVAQILKEKESGLG